MAVYDGINQLTFGGNTYKLAGGSAASSMPGAALTDEGITVVYTSVPAGRFSGDTGINYAGHETIKAIGPNAFNGCFNLSTVSFPNCTIVGESAFAGTVTISTKTLDLYLPNMSNVVTSFLPESSTGYVNLTLGITNLTRTHISNLWSYSSSSSVCKVTLNLPSLTSMATGAFVKYKASTNQSVGSDYHLFGFSADCITSIAASAFYENCGLSTIYIPNAANIGPDAFCNCINLNGTVNLPNCLNIGQYAFIHCSAMTSFIGPNVASVSSGAFEYCSALTTVSLPNATYIGDSAFVSCSYLTNVVLTKATYIGSYAFSYCPSLRSIDLPVCSFLGSKCLDFMYVRSLTLRSTSVVAVGSAFSYRSQYTYSIYVPASLVTAYKAAPAWKSHSSRIQAIP